MTRFGLTGTSVLAVLVAMLAGVPLAHADGHIWPVTDPTPGLPPCEEFFDQWGVPGASSSILIMAGVAREVWAAKKCLTKKDIPTACKHWQGLLVVIDKFDTPLDASRGDIEELMRQNLCPAAPAAGSTPAASTTPGSAGALVGPAPGTDPGPAPVPNSE